MKVKSVEKDSERISLSIKDTLPTPFERIKGQFHEDDVIEGTVVRLAAFGAFVEVAPGVQGLVHISEIDHKHIGSQVKNLNLANKSMSKFLVLTKIMNVFHFQLKATLPNEDVIESDEATTQSYIDNDSDDDNPTLGDMFRDKFKDLKF